MYLIFAISTLILLFTGAVSACPRNCRCLHGNEVECSSSGLIRVPVGIPDDTERLFLDGNSIPVVYAEDFRLFTNLRFLTLANSHLSEIQDGSFTVLHHLEELNLNMNVLRIIKPGTLQGLRSLRILRVDQNQALRMAPCTISAIPKIESINADITRIQFNESLFLNQSVCETSLRELSDYSEEEFVTMGSLRHLRLERADASGINYRVMSSMPNLATLNLQNTAIQTIEDRMFRRNRFLTTLFLTENLITKIGNQSFVGLKKLQVLALSSNHGLQIHPNTFLATRKLKTLYLDQIGLEELTINFFSFQQLTNLIISENELTYISPGILSGVGSIRICLGYNPWQCDCNLVWLYEWLKQFSLGNLLNCMSPVCHTPVNLAGTPLLSLTRGAFQCINDTITEGPDKETSTPYYPMFVQNWSPNLTPTDRVDTWVPYTGGPIQQQSWEPTYNIQMQTMPMEGKPIQETTGATHRHKTPVNNMDQNENDISQDDIDISDSNDREKDRTDTPIINVTHQKPNVRPATGYHEVGNNDTDDGISIIVLCTEVGIMCLILLAILWIVFAIRRVSINRRNRMRSNENGVNMDTVSPLRYFHQR